jgi:uncharacterized protein (DUF2252 family)
MNHLKKTGRQVKADLEAAEVSLIGNFDAWRHDEGPMYYSVRSVKEVQDAVQRAGWTKTKTHVYSKNKMKVMVIRYQRITAVDPC